MVAVLDWELASIGDPMIDLAYACLIYHWPQDIKMIFPNFSNGMKHEYYRPLLSGNWYDKD